MYRLWRRLVVPVLAGLVGLAGNGLAFDDDFDDGSTEPFYGISNFQNDFGGITFTNGGVEFVVDRGTNNVFSQAAIFRGGPELEDISNGFTCRVQVADALDPIWFSNIQKAIALTMEDTGLDTNNQDNFQIAFQLYNYNADTNGWTSRINYRVWVPSGEFFPGTVIQGVVLPGQSYDTTGIELVMEVTTTTIDGHLYNPCTDEKFPLGAALPRAHGFDLSQTGTNASAGVKVWNVFGTETSEYAITRFAAPDGWAEELRPCVEFDGISVAGGNVTLPWTGIQLNGVTSYVDYASEPGGAWTTNAASFVGAFLNPTEGGGSQSSNVTVALPPGDSTTWRIRTPR